MSDELNGGIVPIWQVAAEIASQVPDEEWAKVPRDLARNVDNYIYGAQMVEPAEGTA